MNIVHANDGSSMKIYGDYSPHPVIAEAAIVNELGGPEQAFHTLKSMESLFVRKGTESYPISARDLALTLDNHQRGERHWRWERLEGSAVKQSTGYDYMKGYGYYEGDTFVFVDGSNKPEYTVRFR